MSLPLASLWDPMAGTCPLSLVPSFLGTHHVFQWYLLSKLQLEPPILAARPASSPHTNLSAQDRDGCTPGKGLLPKGSLVTQAMCHIRSGRVGVVTGTALAVKMLSLPRAFYANVNCVFLSFPSLNSLCYLSDIYFCFSQTRLLSVFQTCVSPSLASFPPILMPGVKGAFWQNNAVRNGSHQQERLRVFI